MSDTIPETTEYDALIIEQRDGEPYITNPAPPEHIELSRSYWDGLPVGPEDVYAWREEIPHADPDRDNDGWQITFIASNVVCTYRVSSVPEDGPVRATLASWSER